jgi:hypothetical protein
MRQFQPEPEVQFSDLVLVTRHLGQGPHCQWQLAPAALAVSKSRDGPRRDLNDEQQREMGSLRA